MRIALSCIFLLVFAVVNGQSDTLSLIEDYFHKADSLLERGEYEKARDEANAAQLMLVEWKVNAQEKRRIAQIYFEKIRQADVGITHNYADSNKYKYRVERGDESLQKYRDTMSFMNYYLEAAKILPGTEDAMDEIRKVLFSQNRRTDTILISERSTERYFLLGKGTFLKRELEGSRFVTDTVYRYLYPYAPDPANIPNPNVLVCRFSDSLPYSGVLILRETLYSDYPKTAVQLHILDYNSGMVSKMTTYGLCEGKTANSPQFAYSKWLDGDNSQWPCTMTSWENGEQLIQQFYPDGKKKYQYSRTKNEANTWYENGKIRNLELYSVPVDSMDVTPVADFMKEFEDSMSGKLLGIPIDSIESFNISKQWHENEKLAQIEFQMTLNENSGQFYDSAINRNGFYAWLGLNESGDTTFYEVAALNSRKTLMALEFVDGNDTLLVYINWINDTLTDIRNDNVLYLNKRFRIISEQKYINLHQQVLAGEYLHMEPIPDQLKAGYEGKYRILALPDQWNSMGYKKYLKKVRRALKKAG